MKVSFLFLPIVVIGRCHAFVPTARPTGKPLTLRSVSSLPAWQNALQDILPSVKSISKKGQRNSRQEIVEIASSFVQAYSTGSGIDGISIAEDCTFEDYRFPSICNGPSDIERRFRLQPNLPPVSIDRVLVQEKQQQTDNSERINVGVLFHQETTTSKRGIAWLEISADTNEITNALWTMENDTKNGESKVKLLSNISLLFGKGSSNSQEREPQVLLPTEISPPERYFEAWNRRDIDDAIGVFADNVEYDDTAFAVPFGDRQSLREHLDLCAEAFPPSFTFQVDQVLADDNRYMVQWHVENDGKPLPGSRGLSYYTARGAQVTFGIDFVEDSPPKLQGLKLFTATVTRQLQEEPARVVPLVLWIAYMYIVFLSDGILPGANALQLETRTWEEVRDLSLNFFLVAPLLDLPFSPTVHPMLEGVFNLLLSWAAMFAGFLSDDRKDKPNLLPMLPIVAGMQFLTSAFLLPYLVTRSPERATNVQRDDLTFPLAESRGLAPAMGVVGLGSLIWGSVGRYEDFGNLAERSQSFWELISIDRVGSSFLVDLALFAIFQGWFVDDDKKRRGLQTTDEPFLTFVGKFVPFFGMAAYLTFRPQFPPEIHEGYCQHMDT